MRYELKFKKIVLVFITLIGFYTISRNNIGVLDGQLWWISNPDIFYKSFLPLLMIASALASLIKNDKINLFYLAFVSMMIDAINRFSVFITNYYLNFTYDQPHRIDYSTNGVVVTTNYLPSYIMLFLEIIFIIFTLKYIVKFKPVYLIRNS
jgi:hypothetical protein